MKRLVCAGFLFGLLASAAGPGYHVTKRLRVGGEGGWDYLTVDSAARRLYVSHGNRVVVLDVDAGTVVGFISDGRSDDATIFDLKTLAMVGKVKTGQTPDAIQYDDVSGRVFTFNGRSKDATAFDAKFYH